MEFIFFDASGSRLFVHNDAESATHCHEEMSLQALFPYDAGKVIQRGQRIGYTDALGVFQPFEIRKVRTYEPDHYQEITAEHIVISELSDEHLDQTEITDKTAGDALGGILTGTLWAVGTNTASGTQTADISRGSVWQGVRTIEENWNVYITPRVTFNASGITGRYLDIAPAGPIWRGVRLSLDKNADEVGVTWDDTNVITAIYGYGGRVADSSGDDTETLTFKDVTWSATSSHPAKPSGQAYLEDPTAKALYGRGGRNRFGYYQNSNIDDPEILLEKSWQALQQSNAPDVAIDCRVSDLYRLGYTDQPLALHDSAIIEVRPTGETLQREIIRMTEDLLDPTATRVNIGVYIPNIIYMQRETEKAAKGGGGGGGRGGGGGGGQDNEVYEYETEIQANRYQISLRAYQRDMTNVENILKEAGVAIDASGVIIYAGNNLDDMQASITVNADKIALVVEGTGANAHIKSAEIVAAINESGSTVKISANKVFIDGNTSVQSILTGAASAVSLSTTSFLQSSGGTLQLKGKTCNWSSITYVKSVDITLPSVSTSGARYFLYGTVTNPQTEYGRLVTGTSKGSVDVRDDTKYFLIPEAD
jgi:hypothetical protein